MTNTTNTKNYLAKMVNEEQPALLIQMTYKEGKGPEQIEICSLIEEALSPVSPDVKGWRRNMVFDLFGNAARVLTRAQTEELKEKGEVVRKIGKNVVAYYVIKANEDPVAYWEESQNSLEAHKAWRKKKEDKRKKKAKKAAMEKEVRSEFQEFAKDHSDNFVMRLAGELEKDNNDEYDKYKREMEKEMKFWHNAFRDYAALKQNRKSIDKKKWAKDFLKRMVNAL